MDFNKFVDDKMYKNTVRHDQVDARRERLQGVLGKILTAVAAVIIGWLIIAIVLHYYGAGVWVFTVFYWMLAIGVPLLFFLRSQINAVSYASERHKGRLSMERTPVFDDESLAEREAREAKEAKKAARKRSS